MSRPIRIKISLVLVLILLTACASNNGNKADTLALYTVKGVDTISGELVLAESPVITLDELLWYDWGTHIFGLSKNISPPNKLST
jgi:hypothetical protein